MPRCTLSFQPGYYYHLYNRGSNRQNIFFERENYLYFLRLLRRYLVEQIIEILAYCLMPNHYHLLVYCKTERVTEGMRSLSLAYTKAINCRYNRVGTIFQRQYQATWVDREVYLHHLVQYIHFNPVKAEMVRTPEEWEFSSYRDYAGLRNGTLPQTQMIRELFGSELAYQSFLTQQQLSSMAVVRSLMLDE
ncbi:transposase [Oscillatoria sp. FACHB-1407]|uniref:transposase n=1 Tax=Oscillatoria sp. FACHB-1407 TaxID=2692847 RepID=UPI0016887EBB|nr:transposase [Oscillatoria sp. FACHB-1407]MBD2462184.1 transposase [Oscillatoria sp. FACHB-1407]